ncbi:MAG: glycosyltransferase [Bacteroides sp.]|nr:glycosyltransferase [Bacillota bacterium]MCM1393280.1 glycosyltransferase [[Eubacterium] siraeum]MCM1455417.1 glycosyltransferase [Bacteroides sp.]
MSIENDRKVSVVIPIYKTDKFLKKCLDSVLAQTYQNLEIICVNDASPDKSIEILNEYQEIDERIKIVTYAKNRGLFHARLAGAEIATGDYICFVDSDDTISIDWIRLLVKRAEEEKADMVMGNTVQIDKQGFFVDNNYMSLCYNRPSLYGEEIFDTYMKDEGLNFVWHTVWNKLYSIELWKKCIDDYAEIDNHLIMAEDIAYSTVLFYHAKKMAFSNHDAYFYYRHEEASTSVNISLDRIQKNILDIARVFVFFENFLNKYGIYEKYKQEFYEFKARNFRIYCNILHCRNLWNNKKYKNLLLDGFKFDKLELTRPEDFYFYDNRTPWENNIGYNEKIKTKICDPQISVVSFDLFDTLILRPFCKASTLFDYMEIKYVDFFQINNIRLFAKKRKEAEDVCRRQLNEEISHREDCTLKEIYDTFVSIFGYEQSLSNKLQELEQIADFKLCSLRKYSKELYDLAGEQGKKRIIVTDTYYDRHFVVNLLKKFGIEDYYGLYISSEKRKLKVTGSLFRCVVKDVGVKPKQMLHLGDNWLSDCVKASDIGINIAFIGKTSEIFQNLHSIDNYTGDVYPTNQSTIYSFANISEMMKQIPIDSYHALVANNIFDKPYPSWNKQLRYNANFYFIGNYVLGGEMLGVASELLKVCKNNNYNKIVFLARDGYLPKIAFDIINNELGANISSEYLYVSRRALLSFAIEKAKSFGVIQDYIDILKHQPNSIFEMINPYINDLQQLEKELQKSGIDCENEFDSLQCFERFIKICDGYLDIRKLSDENQLIKQKLQNIFDGQCLTFDLGYSGRIQSILCDIMGKPLDVFFVHSSGTHAKQISKKSGFRIFDYMQYTPKITSIIREYFFSELSPSCIGYKIHDEKLIPLFDNKQTNYAENYIFGEMIRGMKDFIYDYCKTFSEDDFMFDFRSEEISLPFEMFINQTTDRDIYAFRICNIEDKLYFNYGERSLSEAWRHNLNKQIAAKSDSAKYYSSYDIITETSQFRNLPRIKRALVLFFIDNRKFWQKLKKALRRKR